MPLKNEEYYKQCGAYNLLFSDYCSDCTHRNACTKKKIYPLFKTIIELIHHVEVWSTDELYSADYVENFSTYKSEEFQTLIKAAKEQLTKSYLSSINK